MWNRSYDNSAEPDGLSLYYIKMLTKPLCSLNNHTYYYRVKHKNLINAYYRIDKQIFGIMPSIHIPNILDWMTSAWLSEVNLHTFIYVNKNYWYAKFNTG